MYAIQIIRAMIKNGYIKSIQIQHINGFMATPQSGPRMAWVYNKSKYAHPEPQVVSSLLLMRRKPHGIYSFDLHWFSLRPQEMHTFISPNNAKNANFTMLPLSFRSELHFSKVQSNKPLVFRGFLWLTEKQLKAQKQTQTRSKYERIQKNKETLTNTSEKLKEAHRIT